MARRKRKGSLGLIIGILVVLCLIVSGILISLPKPKAEIQVSNLVIEPSEILVGDSVAISADVRNAGGKTGDYQATLTVNGNVQETKNLEVLAEGTQSVSFTFTPTSSGEYQIGLGGLTGSFVAREGMLPSLFYGDSWTYRVVEGDGEKSEVSYEVGGETTTKAGEAVYAINVSWTSPPDPFDKCTSFLDTGTLYPVLEEWSGTNGDMAISRKITFANRQLPIAPWPLETGKEWSVSWEEDTATKEGLMLTIEEKQFSHTFEVEGMENITTAAGKFRCFKIVERDEEGNVVGMSWYSDKVKREVNRVTWVGDVSTSYELTSYNVSSVPPSVTPPEVDFPSVTDYNNSTSGYAVSYPEGWELAPSSEGEEGNIEIVSSAGARGLRLAWLRIQVSPIAGAPTLDEVNDDIIKATKQSDPNFELVSSTKVAAELPWYELEWNSSLNGVDLKGETIVAIKGQQLFVITGWVQAAYSYDYWSALEGVIDSFGILS
jgi:hypothetical protein